MHIEISVTAGPAKGQHFIFTKPTWFLVGREADAQISLPDDPYISRRHCLLKLFPSECLLRDLNSTNGVLVNGVQYGGKNAQDGLKKKISQAKQESQEMTEVYLNNEDEITIGDTRIKIFINFSQESGQSKEIPTTHRKMATLDSESSQGMPVETLHWQKKSVD